MVVGIGWKMIFLWLWRSTESYRVHVGVEWRKEDETASSTVELLLVKGSMGIPKGNSMVIHGFCHRKQGCLANLAPSSIKGILRIFRVDPTARL